MKLKQLLSCLKSVSGIVGRSKKELILKLTLYSALFGLFHVNYIDLVTPGSQVPGYHLWLIALYFAPFIPICLIKSFKDWELLLSLGLEASLMNDLFYMPIGKLLFGINIDLLEWYKWQFGFGTGSWTFNGGFFFIQVTSQLMAVSIIIRVILLILLLRKWWTETAREKRLKY